MNLEEIESSGFTVISFPSHLKKAMVSHICRFMDVNPSEESLMDRLTKKSLSYSDKEFTQKFAKPFRMFPDSVAELLVNWVSSLASSLKSNRSGVNFVCPAERDINPQLLPTSYDFFWRSVRPGKPDVGAPHCDFQFWDIAKGTPLEAPVPFEYKARWKVWVPLVGCDATNSLQILPQSHIENVPTYEKETPNGRKPSIDASWLAKKDSSFTCPLTNFSDQCVLFHDRLVHKGPANQTKNLRLSGEFTILVA